MTRGYIYSLLAPVPQNLSIKYEKKNYCKSPMYKIQILVEANIR